MILGHHQHLADLRDKRRLDAVDLGCERHYTDIRATFDDRSTSPLSIADAELQETTTGSKATNRRTQKIKVSTFTGLEDHWRVRSGAVDVGQQAALAKPQLATKGRDLPPCRAQLEVASPTVVERSADRLLKPANLGVQSWLRDISETRSMSKIEVVREVDKRVDPLEIERHG